MRVTYHQLVGLRVVDRDGRHVGRVVDLVAEPAGEGRLYVTGLLVGRTALMRRIGRARWQPHPRVVAWADIAGLDGAGIRLRVPAGGIRRGRP